MAGTVMHLAIADKINSILGHGTIKKLPLFFGGNIAPDAIHSKKDYRRADKRHTHLCDGIRSYGYGYPEKAQLFKHRVHEFIEKCYLPACEDKDLYFGYVVHLLVDELYALAAFERLENQLKSGGANPDEPGFRQKLANDISDDPQEYNEDYVGFFRENARIIHISASDYAFEQNIVSMLEAVWDYEIKGYIGADEINANKRWAIDTFFKGEQEKSRDDRKAAMSFIDLAAHSIINQLSCQNGIVKLL